MSVSIGIVGLPNVGKSTLFNAITQSEIAAENYPFCTIDPNSGIVEVPDHRLQVLSDISGSTKIIPASIEFTDIAGLVKGASKGEGLGNQFLNHIRKTSAIAHVVRCFEDDNIIHVDGKVDPIADLETINLELIYSDLEQAEKWLSNQEKKSRTNVKDEIIRRDFLKRIVDHLSISKPVRTLEFSKEDAIFLKEYDFITNKSVIYVANVKEEEAATGNSLSEKVKQFAEENGDAFTLISAKIEEDLSTLDPEEKKEFLAEMNLTESGLDKLAQAAFKLLGLQTYLTTGQKETRAWTIKKGMSTPQSAGVIHTDFEKGFIRANIVNFDDFVKVGGWKAAKEGGILRQEGKEYIMQDGDVVEFLFNV